MPPSAEMSNLLFRSSKPAPAIKQTDTSVAVVPSKNHLVFQSAQNTYADAVAKSANGKMQNMQIATMSLFIRICQLLVVEIYRMYFLMLEPNVAGQTLCVKHSKEDLLVF